VSREESADISERACCTNALTKIQLRKSPARESSARRSGKMFRSKFFQREPPVLVMAKMPSTYREEIVRSGCADRGTNEQPPTLGLLKVRPHIRATHVVQTKFGSMSDSRPLPTALVALNAVVRLTRHLVSPSAGGTAPAVFAVRGPPAFSCRSCYTDAAVLPAGPSPRPPHRVVYWTWAAPVRIHL
jgi:hypothetical protein